MTHTYDARIARLREWMHEALLDAALITSVKDIRYLSGFYPSSGLLLVTPERALIMSDSRYRLQASLESHLPFCEYVRENRYPTLVNALRRFGVQALGYQDGNVSARELHTLEGCLPELAFEPMGDILLNLRSRKGAEEIDVIAHAAAIADAAFAAALPELHEGMSEREAALALDIAMLKAGASSPAFSTIIASGEQGALPHATPGERKLRAGDLVVMDFGAKYALYHSDMTRTIGVGAVDGEAKALYALVLEAQLAGLAALRPGAKMSDVDKAARDVIARAGYGDYFIHGLGHGVGLDVHESPWLRSSEQGILEEGMVVTVEPGIYIPGKLGIRIEDLCVVEKSGSRLLSTTPKALIVI